MAEKLLLLLLFFLETLKVHFQSVTDSSFESKTASLSQFPNSLISPRSTVLTQVESRLLWNGLQILIQWQDPNIWSPSLVPLSRRVGAFRSLCNQISLWSRPAASQLLKLGHSTQTHLLRQINPTSLLQTKSYTAWHLQTQRITNNYLPSMSNLIPPIHVSPIKWQKAEPWHRQPCLGT